MRICTAIKNISSLFICYSYSNIIIVRIIICLGGLQRGRNKFSLRSIITRMGDIRKQFRILRHTLGHSIKILTDAEAESRVTAACLQSIFEHSEIRYQPF